MTISKQATLQRYILKIHTSRLRREKWNLTLPLQEARKSEELISLADSQILRWIDELNGVADADGKAKAIRAEIRRIRRSPDEIRNRREIRRLYAELDELQYKQDYLCLIIDKTKDYIRACKGFTVNGIRYKRLLGTSGGIKNSTIVFVSERVYPELSRRIENGRNADMPLVTAKLEAYKSLTCSASTSVSWPDGLLVVNDAETTFTSDVIYLTDENSGEPKEEVIEGFSVTLDATDGCGMMLPSLAERWSNEMHLGYTAGAMNTRCAFEKGMVFAFDFREFAKDVAGSYTVTDAWGNEVDVRNVELVLTTSMLKLFDSYGSCEEYVAKSKENGYTFCVTKTSPETLENERSLNYQFIQPYDLSEEDIDELISPTINEFKEVLHGDWRKTLLFLQGNGMNGENVLRMEDNFVKAIMADRRVLDDPFVQSSVYQLIRNRINEAKVGVVKVHGNYSIVSGDLYLLCQSMFCIPPTGLLNAGEIYNSYWAGQTSNELACFRAPMSCYENIRKVTPVRRDEARHWYRHMPNVTVFNGWDTMTMALNG